MNRYPRKVAGAVAIAITAALALAGCSSGSGGGSPSDNPESDLKIGVVMRTLTTPQWQEVVAGAEEAAKEGGYEIQVAGGTSQEDVTGQISAIEDMLVKGVNGLIVSFNGTTQLIPVLQQAADQGVDIIFVDSAPEGFSGDSLIVSDNQGISQRLSEQFITEAKVTGPVGILDYPGISSVEDRVAGANEAIGAAGLNVASTLPGDCNRQKSIASTEDMLQANPDINAIWGSCDAAAYGAIQAVKAANKVPGQDVQIIGFDGQEEALQNVKDGSMWATVVQDFFGWGTTAVGLLAELHDDKAVDDQVLMDATIVTKENVDEFLK